MKNEETSIILQLGAVITLLGLMFYLFFVMIGKSVNNNTPTQGSQPVEAVEED